MAGQAHYSPQSIPSARMKTFAERFAARLRLQAGGGTPLYVQLLEQLIEAIRRGEAPPGSALPPERTLALALGVSRTTVKRCYQELRSRRLVSSHGRLGTVVRDRGRLDPGMDRLKGFTEEMRELGLRPSSRILERRIQRSRRIAALFARPVGTRFLKLVRARYGDDRPLSLETAWYDLGALPALEHLPLDDSVYAAIAKIGRLPLTHAEQTVEAILPGAKARALFGFTRTTPCLLLKRWSHAADGRLIEYVEGVFRGDVYTYRLRLKV